MNEIKDSGKDYGRKQIPGFSQPLVRGVGCSSSNIAGLIKTNKRRRNRKLSEWDKMTIET